MQPFPFVRAGQFLRLESTTPPHIVLFFEVTEVLEEDEDLMEGIDVSTQIKGSINKRERKLRYFTARADYPFNDVRIADAAEVAKYRQQHQAAHAAVPA